MKDYMYNELKALSDNPKLNEYHSKLVAWAVKEIEILRDIIKKNKAIKDKN